MLVAMVLGLMVTPTPKAYAYFYNNIIEQYIYDDSVVYGVNVPPRIYRIITEVTAYGGTIKQSSKVVETTKRTGKSQVQDVEETVIYNNSELVRPVKNK